MIPPGRQVLVPNDPSDPAPLPTLHVWLAGRAGAVARRLPSVPVTPLGFGPGAQAVCSKASHRPADRPAGRPGGRGSRLAQSAGLGFEPGAQAVYSKAQAVSRTFLMRANRLTCRSREARGARQRAARHAMAWFAVEAASASPGAPHGLQRRTRAAARVGSCRRQLPFPTHRFARAPPNPFSRNTLQRNTLDIPSASRLVVRTQEGARSCRRTATAEETDTTKRGLICSKLTKKFEEQQ